MEENAPSSKLPNLRTQSSQKLDEMLKELGISEDESKSLNRWEKVSEIIENSKANQTEKPQKNEDKQTSRTSIIIFDEVSTNNFNDKNVQREIQQIIELRSIKEVIVQFKDNTHQEIVPMDEMKTNYPLELLNFYEDKYFNNKNNGD